MRLVWPEPLSDLLGETVGQAPVLTMLFTPLFAVVLTTAVVLYAVNGFDDALDRELLGIFDALLVVVLGLVLYSTSAREPTRAPGWDDRIQLLAVIAVVALDALALTAVIGRISDLGLTPNRVAALGLNVTLLADLAGNAWLSICFLTYRDPFRRLDRWHVAILPVLAVWAAVVAVVLPLAFAFDQPHGQGAARNASGRGPSYRTGRGTGSEQSWWVWTRRGRRLCTFLRAAGV